MAEPLLRSLTLRDVDRILEIDAACSGTPVKTSDNDLWRLVAETTTCFAVCPSDSEKIAGFVLADIRPWEFGQRAHVGWIIALGVHPDHQGKGYGELLAGRVLEQFNRLGVERVQTIVDAQTAELAGFFKRMGFEDTSAKVLARKSVRQQ